MPHRPRDARRWDLLRGPVRDGLPPAARLWAAAAAVLLALSLAGMPGLAGRAAAAGPEASSEDGPPADLGSPAEGILLSREELMALPTSGPGWQAIQARVDDPEGGDYRLATRDDSNKDVLAHALAGARLEDDDLKDFVREKIQGIIETPRDPQDVLGTLRHLQTYIVSADLIDLASFDPDLDDRFRSWLEEEIRHEYSGGGGGGSVISTQEKKPNNFGTHAGATRIAAALYLEDDEELRAARDIWYGWATGDPEYVPDSGRVWTGTEWQCDPDRPHGINPEGCSRDGHSIDGVIPEDQERCGEFSWPPCETNYIHGATDGMTLSFWMLARQGEDPWAWGDRAALRQMEWKLDVDQPPYEGYRWQIPVLERAYDLDLPGNAPEATSTNMGYADWWAQGSGGMGDTGGPGDPAGGREPAWVLPALAVLGLALVATAGTVVVRRRRRRS